MALSLGVGGRKALSRLGYTIFYPPTIGRSIFQVKVAIVAKASFLLVSYFLGVWRRKDNKTLFCFENVWLKVEGFGDLIKCWQKYEFRGSTSVALFNKMQALTKGPQEME